MNPQTERERAGWDCTCGVGEADPAAGVYHRWGCPIYHGEERNPRMPVPPYDLIVDWIMDAVEDCVWEAQYEDFERLRPRIEAIVERLKDDIPSLP